MSGGSHDYAYQKLNDIAESFYPDDNHEKERKKVADILRLLSKICHDIEWIDSCDLSQDGWDGVKKMLDRIKS